VVELSEARKQGGAYHDQVIEAAFLHSKLGCYFIGPYARRVSFASQQFRSLDLVEALAMKNKLPDPGPVAVLGGGLAGLTAVAALLGRGCKVDLYEAARDVLTRQREAAHRLVHPTISRWPMEELSLTTCFPFYDWGVGPCHRIMENLALEWRRYFGPAGNRDEDLRIITDTKVVGLISHPSGDRHVVSLELEQGAAARHYELVIVTTGYGAEHSLGAGRATSYWTPDQLEEKRLGNTKFAVGGCGDGGLIDALRLVHNEFAGGWLAFAVAERIAAAADSRVPAMLVQAEHDAMMMWKSISCMAKKPAELKPDRHRMLEPLHRAYAAAVAQLPPDVTKMLDDSLVDMPGKVWLVAPEAKVTVPLSAPIHKLMIVHAIERGKVEWKRGELKKKAKGYFYRPEGSDADEPLRDREVVQRHGAVSGLEGLLDDEQGVASLRLRQFMLADRIEVGPTRQAEPPLGYPRQAVERRPTAEFISSRHPAAVATVEAIDPRFTIDADERGFSYVLLSDEPDPPPGSGRRFGVALPSRLFGMVHTRHGELSSFDALA
jgi:hypothetical protein